MKRHELHVLRKGGVAHATIAKIADVPLRSVERIVHEAPVEVAGGATLAKARGGGRRP